jgi:hypothetical protein
MFQVPIPIIYTPQKLYPNNNLSKISNNSSNVYIVLFMLLISILILVKKMKN